MNSATIQGDAIKAAVDLEKCTSCGVCARVCPFTAIEVDVEAKEDSIVLSLPFEKVEDMELEERLKGQILKKVSLMGMREHFEHSKYLIFRNVYSNEEFVIKYLEEYENDRIKDTKDLAEVLNISLRSLQRVLKKFYQMGLIENTEGHIRLKDREGLEKYKRKFER